MPQTHSPLGRSIDLSGVIRGLLAVGAVIAVGAALREAHYALAGAGLVFFVAAAVLGYRTRRSRQAADTAISPPKSP